MSSRTSFLAIVLLACSARDAEPPADAGAPAADDGGGLDGGTTTVDDAGASTSDAATSDAGVDAGPITDALLCSARVGAPNPFHIPPGCEEIFAAPAYCGAIVGGQVEYFDLTTGAVCHGPALLGGELFGSASLGWAGDAFYACNGSRLMRASLTDGSVVDLGTPCEAVTTFSGGLLVMPSIAESLVAYPSEGDAAGSRITALPPVSYGASRLGASENDVALAWHSTDRVGLADFDDAAPSARDLLLVDYDDWIWGIDLLPSGELVIATPDRTGHSVRVIDSVTGELVRGLTPAFAGGVAGLMSGLDCYSGPPPAPLPEGTFTVETDVPPVAGCGAVADYADTMDNRHTPSIMSGSCVEGRNSNYLGYCDLLDPAATSELHIVGVYQGTYAPGTGGHWDCGGEECVYVDPTAPGIVEVTVHARARSIVLALSSYEAVEWRLTVDPGAVIERVLVSEYPSSLASVVSGLAAGVPVEGFDACDFGYGWEPEHNTGGTDIRRTIAATRALTGLAETTFQGCYAGTSFVVPYL
jgi:hypothetical protein